MAFRLLTKPVGLATTYRPCSRIAPTLFKSKYSAAASSKPISNDANAKIDSTIKTEATEKDEISKTEKVEEEKPSKEPIVEEGYEFGAHHWNMERGAAIALIPLISTQFVYGAHPVVDGLLDYIPKRVYPRLHKLSNWTLAGSTALVMWGCYEFNTNDIGFTEFAQRLFTA